MKDNTLGNPTPPTIASDKETTMFSEGIGEKQKTIYKGTNNKTQILEEKDSNYPSIAHDGKIILVISKNGYTVNGNKINLKEITNNNIEIGKQNMNDLWRTKQGITRTNKNNWNIQNDIHNTTIANRKTSGNFKFNLKEKSFTTLNYPTTDLTITLTVEALKDGKGIKVYSLAKFDVFGSNVKRWNCKLYCNF